MGLKLATELEIELDAEGLAESLDSYGRDNPACYSVLSSGQFVDMVGNEQLRMFDIGGGNMVLMFKANTKAKPVQKQDTAVAGLLNSKDPLHGFTPGLVGRGRPITAHEILVAVKMRSQDKLPWTKIAETLGRDANKLRNKVKEHLRSVGDGSTLVVHDHTEPNTKLSKRKRKHRLNRDEIRNIRNLRAEGKTLSEIAKVTGRSMMTVFNYCRDVKQK